MALLSLAGTFIGSLLGIFGSARMTNFRLEQLEKKVEKHNQVVERMAVAENAISRRITGWMMSIRNWNISKGELEWN